MTATALAARPSTDDPPRAKTRPRAKTIASALVVIAIALRLATLLVPHFFFADEIFQYLEPAHRLLFGDGVVTWEQRYHIRSWVFPLMLAGPMWLGDTMAPGTTAYLLGPKLALLMLSLASLWGASQIGQRISSLHGLLALFVTAIWFEPVYFSTQALTEAAAIPLFLAGAALTYRQDRHSLIVAGLLLATSALIRFQYAPSIAIFAIIATRFNPHRAAVLAIGAAVAVAASVPIDFAMSDAPFSWLTENIRQNIMLGRAREFSTSGVFFYLHATRELGGVWFISFIALAILGARRFPSLAVCAIINLALHSAIAHKEYRFILLTSALITLLAAIGTGDALYWLRRRLPGTRLVRLSFAAAGVWLLASASLAFGPEARFWWRQGTPMLQAFDTLRRAPRLCGVALYGIDWSASGGYTYLHRSVPLFVYGRNDGRMLAHEHAAFDAIVAPASLAPPPSFARTSCFANEPGSPAICLSRRGGGCDPAAASTEINAELVRRDR